MLLPCASSRPWGQDAWEQEQRREAEKNVANNSETEAENETVKSVLGTTLASEHNIPNDGSRFFSQTPLCYSLYGALFALNY